MAEWQRIQYDYMELQLKKPWNFVKERLKEHNPSLTDEDLQYEKGKEDAFLENLSKKMGRSTQEVKEWIESLSFNS